MLDRAGTLLRGELLERFRAGVDSPIAEDEFNRLALRVFDYQYERNRPYAAYCDRRDRTPASVTHWSQIPAVPTAAFKEVTLVCGKPEDAEAVFRTSGTTRGPERRGRHYVLDLTLYHGSLLPTFAAYVLPDGAELPILSLVPSAAEIPDSSLSHMISVVMDRLGSPKSGYFATVEAGLDIDRLHAALRTHEEAGTPVCIVGTSLAFVHWTDHLLAAGTRFSLAPGSRLMDTGGYKGAAREWSAAEMHERYRTLLGIGPVACVNEYGMTELFSQAYDVALRERVKSLGEAWAISPAGDDAAGVSPRVKRAPPWVRTTVVDPDTLEPVPPGAVGLLRHLDLANLGSVACVQTEDLGRALDDGGFELLGRVAGAAPRGCSIAMDLLLEAAHERRS
ncbi:MAG TPA: hypothetical protein VNZ57_07100 [Longimicrobiales bacterium]|nr:hypothetical protein [Longimicrobiales bacterium]